MIPRLITAEIQAALQRQPAVALLGPRQVGKTTLAFSLGQQTNALYLDLENSEHRARLANPDLFFYSTKDQLLILDEIHRVQSLFKVMRGVIDQRRREQNNSGKFLILGSASLELLQQAGESLAGRISYLELNTLSVLEVEQDLAARELLWLRGGFPDMFLAETDQTSLALRKDFIRSYLERDIPMFGLRVPATTLERLWTMLAHRQASLLNASELARSLEVSQQSVVRYIDLLVDLLLLRRLPPYHSNIGKRLVKAPKIFIRDSGLVHALLGIGSLPQLFGHPIIGASWEGFVIEMLLGLLPWRSQAFFYRTAAGAEIDLLIEHSNGNLWAIEIKRSASAKLSKGFFQARNDLKPNRAFMVHAGLDRYPVDEQLEVIGLLELAQELKNYHSNN